MLVYRDASETCEPREQLETVARLLVRARAPPPELQRHIAWVTLLIEAGRLLQGIADAELERSGVDEHTAAQKGGSELVLAIAGELSRSWSRLALAAAAPHVTSTKGDPIRDALVRLAEQSLPAKMSLRHPEGFAFYALYPELYLEAAKQLPDALDDGGIQVIGVRSIGATLAAVVAAAIGAHAFYTVRPVGHPFRRRLALSSWLKKQLLAAANFAVVDEGPGLSGSSFGAVADFLEESGVPCRRIHILPAHAGELGPEASNEHRSRWRGLPRHVADFKEVLLPKLLRCLEPMIGSIASCEDLSAGNWRKRLYDSERAWPPAVPQQERRKYLVRTQRGAFLLKFAGLGGAAEQKLELLRILHEGGFVPAPVGVVHGFVVRHWVEARTLHGAAVDRNAFVARLGAYLGFRRRACGTAQSGASMRRLFEMARTNLAEALGASAAQLAERFSPHLPALDRSSRPIRVDGRLHAWEWLVTCSGELLKADAVDHHAAHDLVGCQDISWDVAGAEIEHELSPAESRALVRAAGAEVSPELLKFMRVAYPAFQLGFFSLAARAHPSEASRLTAAAARYAKHAAWALQG